MESPFGQSFKVNIKLMKILSWYPLEKTSALRKLQTYVMYVTFLILLTILIILNIFIEKSYDQKQLIYVSETLSYCSKLIPFLINGQRIKKCIHYFDDSNFAPRDDKEEKISSECVKQCQRISMVYITGFAFVQVTYILSSLFSKGYKLPIDVWLPYEITSRGVVYYLTILYLFLGCVYQGSATSLIDPLVGGLIYQTTVHLKILKHRLQTKGINPNENLIYENLKKCVQYHNIILRFVEEYQKCFSWVIFSQFFGTTLSIASCCIALITVPLFSFDSALYIFFAPVLFWQVLFYCYYGTLLYEESNTLVTAIYMTDWYEYDFKCRKLLITLMERSKNPIILTAEKFVELTLETFSAMIKGSYSLIALLK